MGALLGKGNVGCNGRGRRFRRLDRKKSLVEYHQTEHVVEAVATSIQNLLVVAEQRLFLRRELPAVAIRIEAIDDARLECRVIA
jgi:hypothetical protein